MDAIIFDIDGTIWDSTPQAAVAWTQAVKENASVPFELTAKDLQNAFGKQMDILRDQLLAPLPPEERPEVLKACQKAQGEYLPKHPGTLYPDVYDALKELSEKIPLYIVSNCQTGYIETFLDTMGVGAYFVDHECSDTGLTKGENIRLVMERNGIDRAFYLGDTQGDLNAADQAGIPFVHAAYGFGRVDRAVPAIQELSQLPALARKLLEG